MLLILLSECLCIVYLNLVVILFNYSSENISNILLWSKYQSCLLLLFCCTIVFFIFLSCLSKRPQQYIVHILCGYRFRTICSWPNFVSFSFNAFWFYPQLYFLFFYHISSFSYKILLKYTFGTPNSSLDIFFYCKC